MFDALRLDPLLVEEFTLDPWQLLTSSGFNASLAQTLGAVTVSSAAHDPVSATESTTLGSVGLSATATAPKADATLSQTLGGVTVAATATDPDSAALSKTLGSVGVSSTATTPEQASLAATLGDVSLAGVATDPVAGSLSATLAPVGLASTATDPDNAALAVTLDSVGLDAQTSVFDGSPRNAALDQTLGSVGLGATAQVPAQASEATTLDAVGFTGTAIAPADGVVSQTLDAIGVSATATDPLNSAVSAALGGVGLSATATDPLFAQAHPTLGPVTAQGVAKVPAHAALDGTLGDVGLHSTLTAGDVAPPIQQEPYRVLRPDPGTLRTARRTGTLLVARRIGSATTSVRRVGSAQTTAARPEGGAVVACRLGNAVLSIFRPKRKPGPTPPVVLPARSVRMVGGMGAVSLSASAVLEGGTTVPLTARLAAALASVDSDANAAVYSGLSANTQITLDPVQAQSNLQTGPLPEIRSAQVDSALGAINLSAVGTVSPHASLAKVLGDVGLASLAQVQQAAVLSKALGSVALSGAASVDLTASLGASLAPVLVQSNLAGAVLATRTAQLAATLDPVGVVITGSVPAGRDATLAKTLGPIGLTALGKVRHEASLAKTLGSVGVSAAIRPPLTASLSRPLGGFGFSATASSGRAIGPTVVTASASRGDGVTDATSYIQSLIDGLPSGGGTVVIPAGVSGPYMIDTTRLNPGGIKLRSNFRLQFLAGAQFKAKTNSQPRDYILLAQGLHDVEIVGAGSNYIHLIGDLDTFVPSSTTTTDEWGHGGAIYTCQRVTIRDLGVTKCVGDGFSTSGCTDVVIQRVVSTHNRRQGLSVVGVSKLLVEDCEFAYTKGTSPECGIDVEPEQIVCQDMTFRRVRCHHNNKFGLLLLRRTTTQARILNVTVEDCEFDTNVSLGFQCKGPEGVMFHRNNVHDNGSEGAWVDGGDSFTGEFNTFHNNYTKDGANAARSFDLTGTSTKTTTDWVLRNFPTTSHINLNYYR